ncbi:MAG TPA: hypothetical protein GX005_04435 [Bacteroidales bacterium]|nr:hypothetical protein [Bacteroidales bacterium]
MKILIKTLPILILISLLYPWMKIRTEVKDYQLKMHLYHHEPFSNWINNYLRIIPNNYSDNYKLTLISDSVNYQIYRNDNMILGFPRHSYMIYYSDKFKIDDLLSDNLVIEAVSKGLANENEVDKYYDLILNKVEFNRIYKAFSRQKKMITYCELLRTSFDSTAFSLIQSASDIDNILNNRPKSEGNIIDVELSPENVNPSSLLADYDFLMNYNHDKEIYFWYLDDGINFFKFEFNNNDDIMSIKHRFIGYLGNEIIHL